MVSALEWYKEITYNYFTETENTFEHTGKQFFCPFLKGREYYPQGGFLHEKIDNAGADVILRFMSGRLRQYK